MKKLAKITVVSILGLFLTYYIAAAILAFDHINKIMG